MAMYIIAYKLIKILILFESIISLCNAEFYLINNKYYFRKTKNCTNNEHCDVLSEYCDTESQLCNCVTSYQYDKETEQCVQCPLEYNTCTDCCGRYYLECIDNVCVRCLDDYGNDICGSSAFATASQVALSIAMILGIMILISLLYRICTKPRYLNAPGRHNAELTRNSMTRISLSSIQIRVMARLQNRPPLYETYQEYDCRQREIQENLQRTNNQRYTEPPPSYDGSNNDPNILPPPYTIAIISNESLQNGILNPSYLTNNELMENVRNEQSVSKLENQEKITDRSI